MRPVVYRKHGATVAWCDGPAMEATMVGLMLLGLLFASMMMLVTVQAPKA